MDNDSGKPLSFVTETSNGGHMIPYTSLPSLHFLHLNSPKLLGRGGPCECFPSQFLSEGQALF